MGRKYFGTDGVRGRVGEAPITPDFVLRLGYAAGRVLARAAWPRAPDGADRQGHAHFRLHARGGPRGRLLGGRRRRTAHRAASHAGRRLPDARAASVGGRRDQRLAQSLRRQRHQVLLRQTATSSPTRSRSRSRRNSRPRSAASSRISSGARDGSTTPPGATSSSARARSLVARPARDAAGGRLRERRGLSHRAARVSRTRRRSHPDRRRAERTEHQRWKCGATHPQTLRSAVLEHRADLGIAVDGDADRAGRSSTPRGAPTTATSCST